MGIVFAPAMDWRKVATTSRIWRIFHVAGDSTCLSDALCSAAMETIFKICTAGEWREAVRTGTYAGSAADRADGFIHLSAAHQVRATATRHFAGQEGLVLVAFPADLDHLRWEASRGGDLFPYVHGPLAADRALWAKPLPLADGGHVFPPEVPA
jgi:uncharacterized protein (DUF952 family)